jgi:hypothetical protein
VRGDLVSRQRCFVPTLGWFVEPRILKLAKSAVAVSG